MSRSSPAPRLAAPSSPESPPAVPRSLKAPSLRHPLHGTGAKPLPTLRLEGEMCQTIPSPAVGDRRLAWFPVSRFTENAGAPKNHGRLRQNGEMVKAQDPHKTGHACGKFESSQWHQNLIHGGQSLGPLRSQNTNPTPANSPYPDERSISAATPFPPLRQPLSPRKHGPPASQLAEKIHLLCGWESSRRISCDHSHPVANPPIHGRPRPAASAPHQTTCRAGKSHLKPRWQPS